MSKVNYDLALIQGVVFDVDGVLSPSTVPLGDDGIPRRMVNIKDGYALQLAVKHGYKIAIITGADAPAVEERFRALGIEDIFSRASSKLPVLKEWMEKYELLREQVAYVGDDIPDFESMKYVGLSVAPRDAATEVKALATYVSPVDGGYGVARDLLEQMMRAKGDWMSTSKAFGW